MITIRYSTIDHHRETRRFKTLAGGRIFAQHYLGEHPDIGSTYAVSDDGVGKITCSGCTLSDLFPCRHQTDEARTAEWHAELTEQEVMEMNEYASEMRAAYEPKRSPGCTCSETQLFLVGCDCLAEMPF